MSDQNTSEIAAPICGDRVHEGWYEGVVVGQHGPWSWVMVDGVDDPRTYRTKSLRLASRPS